MNIIFALFLIVLSGILNGSFASPTKYLTKWRFENIWLQYAIWTFLILPWLTILIFHPHFLQTYAEAGKFLWIIAIGGILFGIGQMCFSLSFTMIGFGLGFVINLGLATSLGFLLPLVLQHPDYIFTKFGLFTLIGTVVAMFGLVSSSYAGMLRDQEKNNAMYPQVSNKANNKFFIGVLLAVIAGFISAGQNLVFSLTYELQHIALTHGATTLGSAIIIWPIFLTLGFIPYALYTLYLHRLNDSFACYRKNNTGIYHVFAIIMAICWFGALLLYSQAAQLIGTLGPLVGWPLGMVLIILVSNFWSWQHGEWEHCSQKPKNIMLGGLALLVIAIIILGVSATLHP